MGVVKKSPLQMQIMHFKEEALPPHLESRRGQTRQPHRHGQSRPIQSQTDTPRQCQPEYPYPRRISRYDNPPMIYSIYNEEKAQKSTTTFEPFLYSSIIVRKT